MELKQITTLRQIDITPKLFVTDYGSYNDGSQFEFGKWWILSDYADSEEFLSAVGEHFKQADKTRPLDEFGAIREELMFTDYELFPDQLYGECLSPDELQYIFDWINLDDDDRVKFEYLLYQGNNTPDALKWLDDVIIHCDGDLDNTAKWSLFEEYYPDVDIQTPYVDIDLQGFMEDQFDEFTSIDGKTYLIETP